MSFLLESKKLFEPHLFVPVFLYQKDYRIHIDLFPKELSSEVKTSSWELKHFLRKFGTILYSGN